MLKGLQIQAAKLQLSNLPLYIIQLKTKVIILSTILIGEDRIFLKSKSFLAFQTSHNTPYAITVRILCFSVGDKIYEFANKDELMSRNVTPFENPRQHNINKITANKMRFASSDPQGQNWQFTVIFLKP